MACFQVSGKHPNRIAEFTSLFTYSIIESYGNGNGFEENLFHHAGRVFSYILYYSELSIILLFVVISIF